MAERKMFATRVDSKFLKDLKHLSVDEEVSISELLEEAMQDLLKKYKKKAKKRSLAEDTVNFTKPL